MGIPRRNAFNPTWFEPVLQGAAKLGAKVLLIGNVGNVTLSWGGQGLLGELLRRGRWLRAFNELRDWAKRNGATLPQAVRRQALPGLEPAALRHWRHGRRYRGFPSLKYCLASPDFLASIEYFGRTWDALAPVRDGRKARASILLDEHGRDIDGIMRSRYGLDQRDPYRDRRLVELTQAIPEDQFFRNGQPRWLARRVLADRLPAEILSQTRRGEQSPEWYHHASRRLDAMGEAIARIERSPLASRVLDVKRMKALFESWPKDAQAARGQERLYQNALQRGIIVGSFLRWFEGGNA
jgi:asparagine synthase (glutamine-hydrolysing)